MTNTEMILRTVLDTVRPRDLAANECIDVVSVAPSMMSDDDALSFVVRYYRLNSTGQKLGLRSEERSIHASFMRRGRHDRGALVDMIIQEIRWVIGSIRPPPPPPKNWRRFGRSRRT